MCVQPQESLKSNQTFLTMTAGLTENFKKNQWLTRCITAKRSDKQFSVEISNLLVQLNDPLFTSLLNNFLISFSFKEPNECEKWEFEEPSRSRAWECSMQEGFVSFKSKQRNKKNPKLVT